MVGDCHLGIHGAIFGPLGKTGMELRQLFNVDPDRLQNVSHHGVRQRFVTDEINVVGVGTSILDDARGRAGFYDGQVITRHGLLDALFALLRAVEGNISNADGGIGFFNFRRADGVGGDVGPALDQRVDPFVDGGDGHDS